MKTTFEILMYDGNTAEAVGTAFYANSEGQLEIRSADEVTALYAAGRWVSVRVKPTDA